MRRNPPELRAIVFSILSAAAFYMLPQAARFAGIPFFVIAWAAMPQRGTTFDATLPIRGRDILASQVLWALPLLWLPLIAWIFAPNAGNVRDVPVSYMLDALAVTTLATLLPYAVRPAEISDLPFLIIGALWVGLAAVSAAIVYLLPPDVALDAFVVAIVVAARVIWMRVPDTLEIAPRKAAVVKPAHLVIYESQQGKARKAHAWKPLLWSLIRNGENARGEQSLYALLILFVFFMYGMAAVDRFQPYVILYLMMSLSMARNGTKWLAAYPLSNRMRLWCVLVPGIIVGLLCLQLGMFTSRLFFHEHRSMGRYAPEVPYDRDNVTRVPLEYWPHSRGGVVPTITSSWGDIAVADTFSVAGLTLYNPYSTRTGNSARFIEWQFGRATTAVYGHPMSIASYKRAEENGTLPPRVLDSPSMRILNLAIIIALALGVAASSELTFSRRLAGRGIRSFVLQLSVMSPFLALLGVELEYGRYPASEVVVPIVEHALWRLTQILPTNLVLLTLIAAMPALAIYALLEWQFGESENVAAHASVWKAGRTPTRPLAYFRMR
jgi:hypothetical protein